MTDHIISLDSEEILNLENQYYNEGFKEGQSHATKQQYLEGKEYGYQTGFQRFLIIGYIQGLVDEWKKNINIEQYSSIRNHIDQLDKLLSDIPITNGDEQVAQFEIKLTKARNKLRVIVTIVKESWKVDKLDELVKELGGELHVSENVEEMW
ncbi:uncharacterized protein RJT21DRAFT_111327 [Scheffersomyces amazonensis]|uniref:uncharacterized protein n=1 Tax=Scheffersomyces amazonensis TaxID=1078765 RepID=UPI00315D4CA0